MRDKQKIEKIIKKTKGVFDDCLLPNGCLVAAPSHMSYYSSRAKSYLYCWPGRDLGFNVTAGLHIDKNIFNEVLSWTWDRAENYQKSLEKWKEGLLFRSYHPNGRLRENHFQPDQVGTLLWAIYEYSKRGQLPVVAKKMIKKSTKGLINAWDKNHFSLFAEDLWEERITHPRFKNNLTYSLAACIAGLEASDKIISNKKARETATQMRSLIEREAYDKKSGYFLRRFGGTVQGDKNIDASLLALIWPFRIMKAKDKRMIKTVKAIERNLTDSRGVYRYQFDQYEGEIEDTDLHYRMGAGTWPLLTFWMSIIQSKMGNRKKAEKYFWLVLDQIDDDLLMPEQIFPKDDSRIGVKPLLWSHAMFVHAAVELGYI